MFDVSAENSFDFLSDEYAELFNRSCATAFQHPVWLDRLYTKLAPSLGAQPLIIAVRASQTGKLAMILPLIRRRYGAIRLVEFADLRVSDYASPVCDDRTFALILADQAACEKIRSALKPYDLLRIEKLSNDSLALDRLLGIASRSSMEMSAHLATLYGPYPQWRSANIDASYQRELDKKRRKLVRKGDLRLECAQDPETIKAQFCAMRTYRQVRFQGRDDEDILQNPSYFEFYLDLALHGSAAGLCRIYALSMDRQPIALVWGLAHRGRFMVLLSGFDLAEYKNKSIGAMLFDDIARDCIEKGDTALDFTIGDEFYKQLFGTQPIGMWMMSNAGSPFGSLASFVADHVPWATKMAKRLVQRSSKTWAQVARKDVPVVGQTVKGQ